MILTKINYFENLDKNNFWEIKDVCLLQQNIIVGLNATGKTRLTNIITNLGKTLTGKNKNKKNGNWNLVFKKNNTLSYEYVLQIKDQKITEEIINEITKTGYFPLLERKNGYGKIYSKKDKLSHDFNPPKEELTINVRRDLTHYPFLEDFINWAEEIRGYSFSGVNANEITIPIQHDSHLYSLTTVPYILNKTKDNQQFMDCVIEDMQNINYPIEKIFTRELLDTSGVNKVFLVAIKEKNLKCDVEQNTISAGMFRALCLIVIIEYMMLIREKGTVIIDDLGEGLDFDRSTKLGASENVGFKQPIGNRQQFHSIHQTNI